MRRNSFWNILKGVGILTTDPFIKVVWDVDDIMWPQNYEAAKACGIEFERLVDFRVNENELLTTEEKQRLNARYASLEHFRNIPWCRGLANIPGLAAYGVRSQVNSNTFSAEGRNLKVMQLHQQIPRLDELAQRFDLVNEKNTGKKRFDDDAMILVDDSPYTIAEFPGPIAVTPVTPWIITPKAQALMRGKEMHYFTYGHTEEAIEIVRLLAIRLMCELLR